MATKVVIWRDFAITRPTMQRGNRLLVCFVHHSLPVFPKRPQRCGYQEVVAVNVYLAFEIGPSKSPGKPELASVMWPFMGLGRKLGLRVSHIDD
jgi:hypothetical protein